MRASSTAFLHVPMFRSLGPYDNLEPIGSGGMGEVYRAHDKQLDRPVAIKVIKSAHVAKSTAHQRFDREAKAIAQIEHPHICPIYHVGHHQGVDYIVMRYLEGETLAAKLRSGPLPIDRALEFGRQIASAIAAAHDKGITHRDLKPSNVMITRQGVAVLLDFGLAKFEDDSRDSGAPAESTATMDITRDGAVLGTIRYMSPEALEHRRTDHRSDVFSFGTVLYEMLTGRRPFAGDSDARAIAAILNEEPTPPRQLRPDTPPELESVILKCLAKDPSERWQSADDVLARIETIASSRSAAPSPLSMTPSRLYRPRSRWLAATVVSLIAAAAAGTLWSRSSSTLPPPPHLFAVPCVAAAVPARALCDGITEALVGRVVRLTPSHRLQVTPQVGGLLGDITTASAAATAQGATHILSAVASGDRIDYSLTGAGSLHPSITVDAASIVDAEERVTAWLVRSLALELSPTEREALMPPPTHDSRARRAFLTGRGRLILARAPADFDAAVDAFQAALSADPALAAARVGLGMALRARFLRTRDGVSAGEALAACEEAANAQPGSAEAHTCLGMLYFARGELQRAAFAFATAVQQDPTNDDAVVWLGRTQENLHLPADAEHTYRTAIDARPQYFNPRVWAANFYRRQTRYDDAANALEEAVALVPGHAPLHAALAAPLMLTGRYEEALAAAQAAIDAMPTVEGFVLKGLTLLRMRQFDASASIFEHARTLGAPDATLLANLGRAYYWIGTIDARSKAAAFYRDAAVKFEQLATQTNVRLPKADLHIALADVYAKLGRPEEARARLQLAALDPDSKERPTDSHQLFFAALVHAQIGDAATAVRWLERAIYWGVPEAELRAWPELDGLRGDPGFAALMSGGGPKTRR